MGLKINFNFSEKFSKDFLYKKKYKGISFINLAEWIYKGFPLKVYKGFPLYSRLEKFTKDFNLNAIETATLARAVGKPGSPP